MYVPADMPPATLDVFTRAVELESKTLGARIKLGLDRAREKGMKLGTPPLVTKWECTKFQGLHDRGLSNRKIAEAIGRTHTTVVRVLAGRYRLPPEER